MSEAEKIVLFHCSNSRSSGALTLLEELGAPYELRVMNMQKGENRQPAYLAVNPMGKVPAILHRGELVTEQVAIMLYLGDLFPAARLTPALDDKRRGPYLRWMAFYGACFEPAMVDKAMKREPGGQAMSPYGGLDAVMETVQAQLRVGPYMLGKDFTVTDVLWGSALRWMTMFGLFPETPESKAYVDRTTNRPATVRVREQDAAMAEKQKAA